MTHHHGVDRDTVDLENGWAYAYLRMDRLI